MDSVVLLLTTGSQINVTGEKQKGAGYSNWSGTSHTVSVSCTNFVGRIYLEASLATDPGDTDWFGIPFNGTLTFAEWPLNPFRPTGLIQGDTGTHSFEFVGNYVWVRARLDRTYLNPAPIDTSTVGSVDEVLMNFGALSGIASGGGTLGIQGPTGPRGAQGVQGVSGGSAERVSTLTPGSSVEPMLSIMDVCVVNNLNTNTLILPPVGVPQDGQRIWIRIIDDGSPRLLTWSTTPGAYRPIGTSLPSTTQPGGVVYVSCRYNQIQNYWDVLQVNV